jgi:integrase
LAQATDLQKLVVSKTYTKGGEKRTDTVPKWQLLTSHAMRRSFATNEYKKGLLTTLEIMAITGHRTESSFLRYIRVTPEEHAKSAGRKWDMADRKDKKKKAA